MCHYIKFFISFLYEYMYKHKPKLKHTTILNTSQQHTILDKRRNHLEKLKVQLLNTDCDRETFVTPLTLASDFDEIILRIKSSVSSKSINSRSLRMSDELSCTDSLKLGLFTKVPSLLLISILAPDRNLEGRVYYWHSFVVPNLTSHS